MSGEPEPELTLKQKMDKVANKFADDILSDKQPSELQVAVFRVLCNYLGVDHKLAPPKDGDETGSTFGDFRDSIRSA